MTNEELKNIWAQQGAGVPPISAEAIWKLAQASERFERTIFWRDAREWIATILVASLFLYAALAGGSIRWLILAAALLCFWPMTYVALLRRKRVRRSAETNLIEHVHISIADVRHQIGLLRSVHWWYLAPIALSISFVYIDLRQWERGTVATLVFWGFGVLLFFGVWSLNQWVVRRHLKPRLRQLEKMLAELTL